MNHWAINQKAHLKEKSQDPSVWFFLSQSHLLHLSSTLISCTKKRSESMYIYPHFYELQKLISLFQQGHLSKRIT